MGLNGLVPSLLVFGSLATLPMLNKTLPDQEGRMKMMRITLLEIAEIKAEQRIATAFRSNLPPSVKYTLKTGDKVNAYSEQQRKWIPGMTIVDLNENHAWINSGSKIAKLNITRVITQKEDDDERQIMKFLNSMEQFKTGGPPEVMITEDIEDDDPRIQSDKFNAARQEEVERLTERGSFKTIKKNWKGC